jgi:hypothetical protein
MARFGSETSVASDPIIPVLDDVARTSSAASQVTEALRRALQQLEGSTEQMAWEIIPLTAFERPLPESIRSCWVFAIRAGAETGAERHPNSHQRSLSLTGSGTFELRAANGWTPHQLVSDATAAREQRWVTIPPATWHRLFVGERAWGMVSFHTVPPEDLIEEKPVDPEHLEGETHQERYAGRRPAHP